MARPARAAAEPRGDVRVRIGELAVHGLSLGRPETLGPALESALTRLIAERGTPASWCSGGELHPRPLSVSAEPGMSAEVLAERLALAVYEGLGG